MTQQGDKSAGEGRRLGRYDLRHELARGGMGAVHLAQMSTPEGFAKWVAVKTIHRHMKHQDDALKMFLDEARIAARLTHPNVCSVFDFGVEEGEYFLVMEYLHGQPLSALIRRANTGVSATAGVPFAITARIVADAARGLHAAHEYRLPDGSPASVVHRDVSPHNVFVLYDGIAKVVDFGIARYEDRVSERTSTGLVKGKVAYMSPEQLGEHARTEVDRQTDVFALGAVLWESLTGRKLFHAESHALSMVRVLSAPIDAPSAVNPAVPAALDAITLRALERTKAKRYATASELARDLERYLASTGEPCGAHEVGEWVTALFANERETRESLLRTETAARRPPGVSHAEPRLEPVDQGAALASSPVHDARSSPANAIFGAPPTPRGAGEATVGSRPRAIVGGHTGPVQLPWMDERLGVAGPTLEPAVSPSTRTPHAPRAPSRLGLFAVVGFVLLGLAATFGFLRLRGASPPEAEVRPASIGATTIASTPTSPSAPSAFRLASAPTAASLAPPRAPSTMPAASASARPAAAAAHEPAVIAHEAHHHTHGAGPVSAAAAAAPPPLASAAPVRAPQPTAASDEPPAPQPPRPSAAPPPRPSGAHIESYE